MTQPRYEQGQVVKTYFPATDGSPGKVRPCIVVSATAYNDAALDIVVMPLTSNTQTDRRVPNSYVLQDWAAASLVKPSVTKPLILSVEKSEIEEVVGQLTRRDTIGAMNALAGILGFRKPPAATARSG